MTPPLNFAIIGCGNIAARHAENIIQVGKLSAVCDIIPEKADQLAARFQAKAYYSTGDLWKHEHSIDVAAVCTPNGLHAEHAIQSMQAGADVLCEKPMCLNMQEARLMMDAEKSTGKRLFVVKQNRYNPPVLAARQMIEEGKLGKILSLQLNGFWNRPREYFLNSWKGTKELDGGILFTQFSHFIDLAYWLAGDITAVKAIRATRLLKDCIETEDTCIVLAEFESGALGTFHFSVNAFEKNMEGSITLLAEKGTVKIGGQYLNTLEYQRVQGLQPLKIEKGNAANDYGFYEGSMSNHRLVYENLVKALKDPDHAIPGAWEGMKTVEIIEKIYSACQTS